MRISLETNDFFYKLCRPGGNQNLVTTLRQNFSSTLKSTPLCFILMFLAQMGFGQDLVKKNESIIFSFTTKSNKTVVIVKTNSKQEVFYRFGTRTRAEFQYPPSTRKASQKLSYSYYLRGGGEGNEGMELNYVYFVNDNFKYIIYDTYYSVGNKQTVGVKVIDLKTKKITDIAGDPKTRKGTLTDFRDNQLLNIGEELFD